MNPEYGGVSGMSRKEQKTKESDERDGLKSQKRERRGGEMVEGGNKEHPPEAGLIYDCNSVFEVDGVLIAQTYHVHIALQGYSV